MTANLPQPSDLGAPGGHDLGRSQRRRYGLQPDARSGSLPFPRRDTSSVPHPAASDIQRGRSRALDFGGQTEESLSGPMLQSGHGRRRSSNSDTAIGVLVPGISLPKSMSGYRPQDVGLLTHATLAAIAPVLRQVPQDRLAEYVLDLTGSLVNGANINRRRVLQQTAAGYVCTYLRRFAPSPPWTVVQAEFQTGQGRTDLAWRNTDTGELFFDEIKTHGRAVATLAAEVVEQARRQASGGVNEFDEMFTGVRIIPFGALHLITLVRPYEKRVLLDPTPSQPLRFATNPEVDESRDLTDGVTDHLLQKRINAGEVAAMPINATNERGRNRSAQSRAIRTVRSQ